MKQLFEPVFFPDHKSLVWDYQIYTDDHYKGYYHWHQCCEVLFVHGGQGNVVVNQQMYEIRPGMLFFFQPYQLHRIYSEVSRESPFVRSIFYIDPQVAGDLLKGFPKRRAVFTALWQNNNPYCGFDLSTQALVLESAYARYNLTRMSSAGDDSEDIALLLLQLLECMGTGETSLLTSEERRNLHYSEKIMKWIEEHYQEEVNLDQLAAETHLSKSYVSRIFHQETGSRLVDYLTARRIKQACRLLTTTDLPVEQIGITVGFPNASYFNKLFKKMLGTTPLKYRKSNE
ncbi:HTH-type transcriptional activator RhaR [Paenibacillus auburnensis]|uniref:HTH-type transcriptional activator RhaR n=1 Tax=Paenibacillus auburnensis TaxID=2905649 RepID=A0ABN8FZZ1_9BACL|nr:AraC family transcriptional regulator [Paenibacillus auburnensis]CAH1195546.1 HTH-type transcriptional activator RhaR [Paenibacillus auburnensis]